MKEFAIAVAVILVIGGCTYFEYSLWHECRATNSFFYCLRVLGNH